MVCKQVQDTVHHILSSRFWSAPVMRNLQKGTLQRSEAQSGWLGPLLGAQGQHPTRLPTHLLGILFLMVVTEQEAGEGASIMRLPLVQTPIGRQMSD